MTIEEKLEEILEKYKGKKIEISYKIRDFLGSTRGILKTVGADGISIQTGENNTNFLTREEFKLITEVKLITTIYKK